MNLNTDFKPVTDSPKEPGTRPLYVDGRLYWYLDSRSDDYPNETIQDIVNGIVNEYNLLDLNKMYRKLVYPNANYIELPFHVSYDSYSIMCSKYDEPEKQKELEKIHLSDVSSDVRTNGGWGKLYKEVSGKELNESGFGTVKICDGLYGIKDGLFNIYSQSNKEYSINEF